MRTKWIHTLTILSVFVICAPGVAAGPHIHRIDGTEIALHISDSVVSLLFVASAQPLDSAAFAGERPELSDDYPVRNLGGGLYIFGVEPGLDIASVMQQLRTDPRVRMANPVLDDGDGHERWMNDRLIVRFRDAVPTSRIDSLNQALTASIDRSDPEEPMLYFVRVRPDLRVSTLDVAELYYETGFCLYVQPDFISRPILYGSTHDQAGGGSVPPPDTFYAFQWHWDNWGQSGGRPGADIDADSAWLRTKGDSSVRVAIIDYGFVINPSHEDVDSLTRIFGYDRVGGNRDYPQPDWDPHPACTSSNIQCWHGTACLGELAAAHSNGKGLKGLAPHCTYWAIKWADDQGQTYSSLIRGALHDAWTLLGCQIVSNSWGTAEDPTITAELDAMYQNGILVVFSTGNKGAIHYPATLPSVITVGGTDDSDVVTIGSGKGLALDFVAPSVDIWTWDLMGDGGFIPYSLPASYCDNSEDYNCVFTGTSASAPMVAGVAALVLSLRPDFMDSTDPAGIIRRILEASSDTLGPHGYDTLYGWGRVNAYHALLAACSCPSQGDVNDDTVIDLFDVIQEIAIAFSGGLDITDPGCPASRGDVNNDNFVDAFDVIQIIAIAFSGGFACNPCTPGVPAGCP